MIKRTVLPLALACALGFTMPGWTQTALSPSQARVAASQLLHAGQPRAALEILDVLVARDDTDAVSHILSAHAHRMRGNYPLAYSSAREGWRRADPGLEQYGAAIAAAQALSKMNKKSRSQLWLRRAAEVAPTEQMRQRAMRDYQFVRMTNPLSVHLSFSINPNDNVNNAPINNTMVVGGLVFTDRTLIPLSGLEIETGVKLRYNYNVTQTKRDFLSVSFDATDVIITDDDKPDRVDASDFKFRRIEAAFGRDFQTSKDAPRRTIVATFGRIWYGGEHLSNQVELAFSESYQLSRDRGLTWYTSLGYTDRQDNDKRSGTDARLGATWSRATIDGSRVSLTARLSRVDTDSAALNHTGASLGATYRLGKPTFGAETEFSVITEFEYYDKALYGPDAREDKGITLSTSFLLKDFDTHGFAPKITLRASRTNSNIERFKTQSIGVNIGFESVF